MELNKKQSQAPQVLESAIGNTAGMRDQTKKQKATEIQGGYSAFSWSH